MSLVEFTKMAASGNDFIVLNNLFDQTAVINGDFSRFAKKVCRRRFSIGADGVLVLLPSNKADLKMRIFNADGSEAEMCGNGIRCAALFAHRNGFERKMLEIDTIGGIQKAQVTANSVKFRMPDPKGFVKDISLKSAGKEYIVTFINTGVPHAVHFVKSLEKIDIKELGSAIRHHKRFKPNGTNVNFVEVINKDTLKVRTYERGVEDETLACGTGSAASAIVSALVKGTKRPVYVITRSGNILNVSFNTGKNKKVSELYLEGDASIVYQGRVEYV